MSKSTDTLAKYDKVITDQLEHGVIKKVESIDIPGKVKCLLHQASLEMTVTQQSFAQDLMLAQKL